MGSFGLNQCISHMEWSRVEIDVADEAEYEESGIDTLKVGLDVDAEKMHEFFLSGIPHLSDVQSIHEGVVSGVSGSIEKSKGLARSTETIGEFLIEVGGVWSESEVRVPLPVASQEAVVIETSRQGGVQLVRLISPERFGGMLRTFSLPDGQEITGAHWEGEILSMRMSG